MNPAYDQPDARSEFTMIDNADKAAAQTRFRKDIEQSLAKRMLFLGQKAQLFPPSILYGFYPVVLGVSVAVGLITKLLEVN